MNRPRVRCWICGHRARRTAKGTLPIVGGGEAVTYGSCPVRHGTGSLHTYDKGWACGGVLLRRDDCRRVVRAALKHERRGGNRASEYDL